MSFVAQIIGSKNWMIGLTILGILLVLWSGYLFYYGATADSTSGKLTGTTTAIMLLAGGGVLAYFSGMQWRNLNAAEELLGVQL
jgi:hypothetical protein